MNFLSAGAACLVLLSGSSAVAQTPDGAITIHVDRPGHPIGSNFYGLMTEEINHAYDGGLYAELIRNRSFRDNGSEPVGWSAVNANLTLDPGTYPNLKVQPTGGAVEISNEGYWGIPVVPNTTYRATVRVKASADFAGPLTLSIQSKDGQQTYAQSVIPKLSTDWNTYEITLKTGVAGPTKETRFTLGTSGTGTLLIAYASLFPPTFRGRSNGTRPDLMELLDDLKPSFLRMPGGNYLEGNTLGERFNWKSTIGRPMIRPGHQGPWGYRSSDGFGLLEFLEWCGDLHMKPLLAVFAGYALGGEHVAAGPGLTPFVQDALDEIEYVTGDASTKWGGQRSADGHPQPFPLSYVEIGNEDQFDKSASYDGRFAQFYDAIKAKYPKLQVIATMPVHGRTPDVVDDHYYRSGAEMARDSGHYDSLPRTGPKIFVGEWASTEGSPTPNLRAALGDAAWLTGLERDSDLVVMESYAPLLVNVNSGASQWGTNLIGYDALESFGSPSYYVQSMFAHYTGKAVLPSEVAVAPQATAPVAFHGGIGLGSWITDAEYKDIEVTHEDQTLYKKSFDSGNSDWKPLHGKWVGDGEAFRQTTTEEGTLAVAGDPSWTNYTYHLKAKKLGGAEGFIVPFHVIDEDNYWFWNVGGWRNTRSAIQRRQDGSRDEIGQSSNTTVETGRWYDIRIEVANGHIRCYLDNKLVNEADEVSRPPVAPLYVAASEMGNGETFVKVVNVSDRDLSMKVNLDGAKRVGSTGSGLQIKGSPDDVNSIQQPKLISPSSIVLAGLTNTFPFRFPAHSVTVLRLNARR